MTQTAPLKLLFSTENIPARDRLEHWREMSKAVHKIDWYPLADGVIQQEAAAYCLPGLRVIEGISSNTGFTARRTPELLAREQDDLILDIQIEGCLILSQLGRETRLGPGEAVLASSSDVGTAIRTPNSRFIALRLPRRLLAPMLREIQSRICVRLPREAEATRLLLNYVSAVIRSDALENSSTLRDLVVAHVYDLIALAVAPKQEVIEDAQRRGLAAARLRAIKSDVVANLGDSDMTESSLAKRHRLSPRYMRMLFAAEGMTFSDFLRCSRLTRAHQILTDPRNCGRTISSIAYEVGFGDLSHFNRLFRAQYGARPSEVRAQRYPFL
ncbi:MAG: helix-turn-helix domain-containing protein [Alphaproteobacteria bacterium]|nr:MAG: helix-turn-helix domain-containing protein [Alphaproteobacteria bacterium]